LPAFFCFDSIVFRAARVDLRFAAAAAFSSTVSGASGAPPKAPFTNDANAPMNVRSREAERRVALGAQGREPLTVVPGAPWSAAAASPTKTAPYRGSGGPAGPGFFSVPDRHPQGMLQRECSCRGHVARCAMRRVFRQFVGLLRKGFAFSAVLLVVGWAGCSVDPQQRTLNPQPLPPNGTQPSTGASSGSSGSGAFGTGSATGGPGQMNAGGGNGSSGSSSGTSAPVVGADAGAGGFPGGGSGTGSASGAASSGTAGGSSDAGAVDSAPEDAGVPDTGTGDAGVAAEAGPGDAASDGPDGETDAPADGPPAPDAGCQTILECPVRGPGNPDLCNVCPWPLNVMACIGGQCVCACQARDAAGD